MNKREIEAREAREERQKAQLLEIYRDGARYFGMKGCIKLNLGLDKGRLPCPRCGSHRNRYQGVKMMTQKNGLTTYPRLICQECGKTYKYGHVERKGLNVRPDEVEEKRSS